MHRPGIIAADQAGRDATAAAFEDGDVARCYAFRPPYAPALYERLLGLSAGRSRALDIGCGPGKIAAELAPHFAEVVALDASTAMIAAGRAAQPATNIVWETGPAEAYETETPFDLVTAGTAIHWPDHALLFPKLARWTRLVAIVTGDAPTPAPCGEPAWTDFVARWVGKVGGRFDPAASAAQGSRHEAWMDIAGRERFAFGFRQSVADFVACQHSRATWSRVVMGLIAAEFDAELTALMSPFAEDGVLTLAMVSELTWGAPRATARA